VGVVYSASFVGKDLKGGETEERRKLLAAPLGLYGWGTSGTTQEGKKDGKEKNGGVVHLMIFFVSFCLPDLGYRWQGLGSGKRKGGALKGKGGQACVENWGYQARFKGSSNEKGGPLCKKRNGICTLSS